MVYPRNNMIEIDIPSIDPIQHEPKIFFGMTKRQCLCAIPGAALGALVCYMGYKVSLDFAIVATIVVVAPFVALGWWCPFNMKCEEYIRLWIWNNYIAESKRIYKTDNADDVKMLTIKERKEKEKKEQAKELAEKKKRNAARLNKREGNH